MNRYRQMASLLYKFGRSDLVDQTGLSDQLNAVEDTETENCQASNEWSSGGEELADSTSVVENVLGTTDPNPEELVKDFEALGPTFIKLGQLLSTRSGFLPASHRAALTKLQDDADPIDTREVFRVIEEELGKQPEHIFAKFDVEPLATASLGQVHRATMKDGRNVVVKVQRPGVVEQVHADIEAMEELASACEVFQFGRDYQLKHMVASLKFSLSLEVDYLNEATNARTLIENLGEFQNLVIPEPIEPHSTARVLTMEFVECDKITELAEGRLSDEKSRKLANELFVGFLHQVLIHGAFHADPHPGNVALTKDDTIVLMDHGLVVKVSGRLQSSLIKLLLAISDGDGAAVATVAEKSGIHGDNFEPKKFQRAIERIVADNINQSVDQLNAGTTLMEIQKVAGQNDLQMPQEVILLGRALLHLEGVVAALDPKFDPNEAIRTHTMEIMQEHSGKKLSLSSLYQALMETSEFAQELPSRANKVRTTILLSRRPNHKYIRKKS